LGLYRGTVSCVFLVVKVWFCLCYFLPTVSFLSYCHNSRSTGFGVLTYGCGCNVLDGIAVVNVVVVAVISLVAINKNSLTTTINVFFEEAEVTFRHMGIWLCRACFRTHTFRTKCQHGNGSDFVPPPNCGNGIVRFVLYDLTKPQVASSSVQLDHVGDLVLDKLDGFTLPL
nr:splicing factor U2af large subunit B [Tanacetum cinerariifolium]